MKTDQSDKTDPSAKTALTHAALAILALVIEIGGLSLYVWDTFFHVHKVSPINVLLMLIWVLGPAMLVAAIATRKSKRFSRMAHLERMSSWTFYGALSGLMMTLVLLLVLGTGGYRWGGDIGHLSS
jgi:hypothetical protein